MLRTIFGGAQKNGGWQQRMNHELATLQQIQQPEGNQSREPGVGIVGQAWLKMSENTTVKLVFVTDSVGT